MQNKAGLKDQVLGLCRLDKPGWEKVFSCFEHRPIPAGGFLLKQEQTCDFVAYVQSGAFVYFRALDNGTDFTTDFAFAGDWAGDMYSRLNGAPSFLNIKALEDSEVSLLRHTKLEELYEEVPGLERLGRRLTENAFVRLVRQTLDLQITDAKERYSKLVKESPDILQKVPLYHVANYLGIAPKSLSRIRKELSKG